METLIGLSLGLIAVLTFYRWVDRRHKIFLVKVGAGAGLIIVVGVGVMAVLSMQERRAEERKRAGVTVSFVDHEMEILPPSAGLLLGMGTDTIQTITFAVCNLSDEDDVTGITFSPMTLERGRSTEHRVIASDAGSYSPNELFSDYILSPQECIDLSWSGGRYLILDSVVATIQSVETKSTE